MKHGRFLIPLLGLAIILLAFSPSTALAATVDPPPVKLYSAKIGEIAWGGSTIYLQEGSTPQLTLYGPAQSVKIQKLVGSQFETIQEVTLVPDPGKSYKYITVPLAINNVYEYPAAPQKFRIINSETSQPAIDFNNQNIVVFKKAYTPPSEYKGRWGWNLARYSACRTITYKVDVRSARGSNANALKLTKAAVTRVAKASGLKIVYAGTVSTSNSLSSYSSADITIRYGEIPGANDPAGKTSYSWESLKGTTTLRKLSKAKIVIDQSRKSSATNKMRTNIVMHETMHALGMNHSNNKKDIMYPVVGASTFGGGDLQGFKVVGANGGCF